MSSEGIPTPEENEFKEIRITTPRGVKTPEGALELLKDTSLRDGDVRGILNGIKIKAPHFAGRAAEMILNNSYSRTEKTLELARTIREEAKQKLPDFAKFMSDNKDRFQR